MGISYMHVPINYLHFSFTLYLDPLFFFDKFLTWFL